jgi:hypothetical protein
VLRAEVSHGIQGSEELETKSNSIATVFRLLEESRCEYMKRDHRGAEGTRERSLGAAPGSDGRLAVRGVRRRSDRENEIEDAQGSGRPRPPLDQLRLGTLDRRAHRCVLGGLAARTRSRFFFTCREDPVGAFPGGRHNVVSMETTA